LEAAKFKNKYVYKLYGKTSNWKQRYAWNFNISIFHPAVYTN
jgi:hypothetical protein